MRNRRTDYHKQHGFFPVSDGTRGAVLDYLRTVMQADTLPPTLRAIGEACYLSRAGVWTLVQKLHRAGELEYRNGMIRAIRMDDGTWRRFSITREGGTAKGEATRRRVFEALVTFTAEHGRGPSRYELANVCAMTTQGVMHVVNGLAAAGLVEHVRGVAYGIRPLRTSWESEAA